ncbi:MFS transporter [Chloroflexota bacterium]
MIRRIRVPKIFFGWYTVLATCLLCIWGTGYSSVGFSALFKPISTELGLSRAVTSVARSIGLFEAGFSAPIVGWLNDRFGPKVTIFFGTALIGLGLVLMSSVNSLWAFYVVWGVVVYSGVHIALTISVDKAISNWFIRRRGLAQSFRWVSMVLSTILVVPLISWLIISVDWRMTCVIGGVVIWLFGLPLVWFFIKKERPEYYGLLPDGASTEAELVADKSRIVAKGTEYAARFQEVEFTLRQAIRTLAFWQLTIGYISYAVTISVVFTHCIPLITDMGYSPIRAAGVMSMAGAIGIPFRFASGFLADRLKKEHLRFLMGISFLIMPAGIIAFSLHQTMATVYALLILFYIGQGPGAVLMSVIRARYFGRKGLGSIQGASLMITMPFNVIAPIYAGWVYDTTGSYLDAFRLFAGLLVFGALLIFCARPPKPPAEVTDIRKFL